MKGLKNVKAYIHGKGIITVNIGFENGKIAYVGESGDDIEPILTTDKVVLSGFIDEHIHGAGGADAMDGTESALQTVSECLAKEGTTGFLATTMTQSAENIEKALCAVKSVADSNSCAGARVLGAHLEGPFISEKHIGAQPLKYLRDPDVKLFEEFNVASGKNVRLITLAPEEMGAGELIRSACVAGVTVSAGHTDAGVEQIAEGIKNGLTCITHTYNAMRPLHHRQAGTVGAALLFDDLYTEVICDLIHVSAPALRLLLKNKPKDKVVLITDAMRAKGLPDGESELGGQKVFVKGGEARLADGTLAGSVLKMNVAIKNLVEKCGVPFTDAVDFATVNPAKNLGIFDKYGSIEVGKAADFTALDENFNVLFTIVGGKAVYLG